MNKGILITTLILGMMAVTLMGKEPSARIDTKQFSIPAGRYAVTNTAYLNVGDDPTVIGVDGVREKIGAGAIRAVVVTIDSPVTNGAVAFYTYDKGVQSASAFYSKTAITGLTYSVRYNLTTNLYSGRILAIVNRGSTITNGTATAGCSFIVE